MNTEEKPGDQSNSKTRSVDKTIVINAPVSDVWKALTQADELTRWFPLQAEVKPGPGGKMRLSWDDLYIWEFKIESWEEEKHLRCTYQHDQDYNPKDVDKSADENIVLSSPQQLAVDYFLETNEGVTTVRLVHSGFEMDSNWDEMYDGVRLGWNQELRSLKFYLENQRGNDRSMAWSILKIDMPIQEIWNILMGSDGLSNENVATLNEGDKYRFQLDDGITYQGEVLYLNYPWAFMGNIENMDNAIIRIQLKQLFGKTELDIMIGAYGKTDNYIQKLKEYWDLKLSYLFTVR